LAQGCVCFVLIYFKTMRYILWVSALGFAVNEDKNRPVTRVVNLLKDMRTTLEKEAKEDQEVYDQMACWCKTNDKEKTASIKKAEETINQLTANIEEFAATSARLETEIKNLEGEVAANQTALDKATAIRKKQLEEMNAEEKDLIQSIQALKAAIIVLSKHNPSMIQHATLENIASLLSHQMNVHQDLLGEVISPEQKRVINLFVQAPGGFQSHGSQSGEIFGILSNMRDTFEANLSASQREELENARSYEALKAAKTDEITAGQSQIDKKQELLANAREARAEAKQNLEDTRNSLSADEAFLMDLKTRCGESDAEWEQRQRSRNEEVVAIGEALKILSSDDARDTFTKTFNFVQETRTTGALRSSKKRSEAAQVIDNAAKKFDNPRLAHLATAMRLDAFTKVKKAIDDMIRQLLKEKDDEIKHRDWCTDALHQNQISSESTRRDIADQTATVEGLESDIKTLSGEIETLKAEVAEIQVQVKRAGENRAKGNADFQETIKTQRETQQLLQQAIGVLKNVYEKKQHAAPAAALVQQKGSEPAGPPPPSGFKTYEKSGGAQGVLALLTQIAADAKAVEAEAIHDEESAQKAYESFVKESNRSVNEKDKGIVNKEMNRSLKEQDKVAEETSLKGSHKQSETLSNEEADIHKSCDFVTKNFDIRQEARDQEVEALRQANAILSGSNFGSFLQKWY